MIGEVMKKFLEPYAKEKNTLQLALFYFGKGRPEKNVTEWSDQHGNYKLECVCKYGIPGSFEQDVYTATMRIWIKQNRPRDGIKLSYSDIAKELHLEPPKHYVGQIKKSLERLAQARYEFNQCFIQVKEGEPKKIDTHFSLYDSASLFTFYKDQGKSKRTGQSTIIFPQEIQKNLDAQYYQLLDMTFYRKMKEGLPRRLYEYLEKRKYHSDMKGKFFLSEEALCRWLPVTTKNVTERRKTLQNITQSLIDCGYLLSYSFCKKNHVCIFVFSQGWPGDVKIEVSNALNDPLPSTSILDVPISDELRETYTIPPVPQLPQPPQLVKHIQEEIKHTQPPQEAQQSEVQKKYVEALSWLETIPYFHKLRREDIAKMPFEDVARCFPSIKAEYEKQKEAGVAPKTGWLYKAFMERWEFSQEKKGKKKTEREIAEEKKHKALLERFDSLPQERQEAIKEQFKENYKEHPEMLENQCVWLRFIDGV